MLYPFQWQHVFIPLLPSKLLSYAASPVPFMIGVRRYLLPNLLKEAIDDILLVDLDTGECTTYGKVPVKDFVGSAGTFQRQAVESLDRVKAGMLKAFSSSTGKTVPSGAIGDKDRDLAACLLADLRAGISRKPGGSGGKTSLISQVSALGKTAADGSKER
jgi:hypothetical protein